MYIVTSGDIIVGVFDNREMASECARVVRGESVEYQLNSPTVPSSEHTSWYVRMLKDGTVTQTLEVFSPITVIEMDWVFLSEETPTDPSEMVTVMWATSKANAIEICEERRHMVLPLWDGTRKQFKITDLTSPDYVI